MEGIWVWWALLLRVIDVQLFANFLWGNVYAKSRWCYYRCWTQSSANWIIILRRKNAVWHSSWYHWQASSYPSSCPSHPLTLDGWALQVPISVVVVQFGTCKQNNRTPYSSSANQPLLNPTPKVIVVPIETMSPTNWFENWKLTLCNNMEEDVHARCPRI